MAGRGGFDAELTAVEALRHRAPEQAVGELRKALAHRNGLIVSKAAKLAALQQHGPLVPELVAAWERFLPLGAKGDPQCWAKRALVEALAGLEYNEPEIYLAGLRCVQMEPSWGGAEDSAGPVRSVCALALPACRRLTGAEVLRYLVPLLADREVPVQVSAARAIAATGTEAAGLLLRMRAELGNGAGELLGACYSGVLQLEGAAALPWVAGFLPKGREPVDEAAGEAAFAIAETRVEAAFPLLRAAWEGSLDGEFRATVLQAMAVTRLESAVVFLLERVRDGNRQAREALERLEPGEALRVRLRAALEESF